MIVGEVCQCQPELVFLFAGDNLLARSGPIDQFTDFRAIFGKRDFAIDLAFLYSAKPAGHIAEIIQQNPLQPDAKLTGAGTREARKRLLCIEKRLLHEIRLAALLLEIRPELAIRKEAQIGTEAFQEVSQRGEIALTGGLG